MTLQCTGLGSSYGLDRPEAMVVAGRRVGKCQLPASSVGRDQRARRARPFRNCSLPSSVLQQKRPMADDTKRYLLQPRMT